MPNDLRSATDLFTPCEAAERLRIGRRTLDRACAKKVGPAQTLIGNRVFFTAEALERFIVARTEKEKLTPPGLAAAIAAELHDRDSFPTDWSGPLIELLAPMLETLRQVDLAARTGLLDEDGVRKFVHVACRLSRHLLCLSQSTHEESLAFDVVQGALLTAATRFPDILSEAAKP